MTYHLSRLEISLAWLAIILSIAQITVHRFLECNWDFWTNQSLMSILSILALARVFGLAWSMRRV